MENVDFLKILSRIFEKEGIVSHDNELLQKFLPESRKNAVITIAEKKDGSTVFFKAIKPESTLQGFLDYEKGIITGDLLKRSGVTFVSQLLSHGEEGGVKYIISTVLPIKKTLTDDSIIHLAENDSQKIQKAYTDTQTKLTNYLKNNPQATSLLYHDSFFWEISSFVGQISIFEQKLKTAGYLKNSHFTDKLEKYVRGVDEAADSTMYLLHGDMAPHNIVLADDVFFIDWERAFVTRNPLLGEAYDMANLYVYAFKNPLLQKTLYTDSESFQTCMLYHLLYKTNYILAFNVKKDNFFKWCINTLRKLDKSNF